MQAGFNGSGKVKVPPTNGHIRQACSLVGFHRIRQIASSRTYADSHAVDGSPLDPVFKYFWIPFDTTKLVNSIRFTTPHDHHSRCSLSEYIPLHAECNVTL